MSGTSPPMHSANVVFLLLLVQEVVTHLIDSKNGRLLLGRILRDTENMEDLLYATMVQNWTIKEKMFWADEQLLKDAGKALDQFAQSVVDEIQRADQDRSQELAKTAPLPPSRPPTPGQSPPPSTPPPTPPDDIPLKTNAADMNTFGQLLRQTMKEKHATFAKEIKIHFQDYNQNLDNK